MGSNCTKYIGLFLFFFFALGTVHALDVPALKGRVNDNASVLSRSQRDNLESHLAGLESRTGIQMAVLTIKSLKGSDLEEYSIRVVDEWKLGQAGKDNGILLLLAVEDRKVRLEVGYGLEGELTDLKAAYIVREIMIPRFSKGDYAGGIEAGTQMAIDVVRGDLVIKPEQLEKSTSSSSGQSFPINLVVILFIILFNSFGRLGGRRRGGLFQLLVLNSLLGSGSSRRGGGFGSGGGGFGGGGGFSGGGGGFGGGGASGGW